MSESTKVDRRNYLKFVGAGAVVLAGTAAGAFYLTKPKTILTETFTSTSEVTTVSTFVTITAVEAKQLIESNPKGEIVILDVRTVEEYVEAHITGAILIPLQNLAEKYTMIDKNKIIIVYCRTGVKSAQASQVLIDNGFTKVYNMDGGITAWMNKEFPIESPNNCGCE